MRECVDVHGEILTLPRTQRMSALNAIWPPQLARLAHVYAPDGDDTRPLAPIAVALQQELGAAPVEHIGGPASATTTHLILLSAQHLVLGQARAPHCAPIASGIPRLRFPAAAPSRSTLKLDEALLLMLSEAERQALFQPGMTSVDLGACPGGWTYQLLRRGLRVVAIDNGRIDEALMRTGRVEHLRVDGFKYTPPKPVNWLVCDMVESPLKVAELAALWFRQRYCQNAVINLKLPMKKRWQR
ncbi:23S rRNA (cytidine(2498)-2'-O)-methyltransferase RlmM [bacterium]|nr:23S rRNA (cytidine(2498)-2'-O)-methyltransferase RlmM [bacterium]